MTDPASRQVAVSAAGDTGGRRTWAFVVPVCLAYAILLLCWGGANPPFASPDEWSHYIRALGLGGGELIGPRFNFAVPSEDQRLEYNWMNQAARTVWVPGRLYAADIGSNAADPDKPAYWPTLVPIPDPIVVPTPTGNYQPLPYCLPGLFAHLGRNPFAADWLGRCAAGLTCWSFLVLAVVLLWDGSPFSLIGFFAAVSPMVLFISACLTPSGLEIAAGIAFAAALIRLCRDDAVRGLVWLALGIAGAVLALSRSTGPLFVGLDLLVLIGLLGARGLGQRMRQAPVCAALAALMLAAGTVLNRLWESAYGSRIPTDPAALVRQIGHAVGHSLPRVLEHEVGAFGSLDSRMPLPASFLWLALIFTMILVALRIAPRRQRLVLAAACAGSLAVPVAFSMLLVASTGFDVQGRHMLPLVVIVPLLAGEMVARNRSRLPVTAARAAFTALVSLVALVHLIGWYWNARRHAVGAHGPLCFLGGAQWQPPFGWWPWLVLTGIGVSLLLLTAAPTREKMGHIG